MDHDTALAQMRASGRTDASTISTLTEALVEMVKEQPGTPTGTNDRGLAALAEQHFSSASWLGWLDTAPPAHQAQTWKAAQQWKQLSPARFGPAADNFTERIRRHYGDDLAKEITDLGPGGLDSAASLIEQAARTVKER